MRVPSTARSALWVLIAGFVCLASAGAAPQDGAKAAPPAAGGQNVAALAAEAEQDFGRKSDPEAIAIVERYLEAIGGRETLLAINDSSTKFINRKLSATGATDAVIALYLKRPHKYREEWDIKGFQIKDQPLAFVQIYNGDQQEGWVQMLGTVSTLEGRTLSVFVWDKSIDDPLLHWEEDGYSLARQGDGLVEVKLDDGKKEQEPADIVEVTDFSGKQKVQYFFSRSEDPARKSLLLKKEWFDSTQKETTKKEQFFTKYVRIKFSDASARSLLFALRSDIRVDGDTDTERIYTLVKYNAGLSDKLFEKPEGKPFTGAITQSTPEGEAKQPDGSKTSVTPAAPAGSRSRGAAVGTATSAVPPAPATGTPPAPTETPKSPE